MGEIKENDNEFKLLWTASKKTLIAVVVLLTVAAIVLLIGPARIEKVAQKAIDQDFDRFRDDNNRSQATLSESGAVRIELNDGYIEIVELMIGPESTQVTVHLDKVPGLSVFSGYEGVNESGMLKENLNDQLRQIYLRDEAGRKYHYQEGNFSIEHTYSSACATGVTWFSEVYIDLPPLDPEAGKIALLVPLPDGSEIEIDIPLEALRMVGP